MKITGNVLNVELENIIFTDLKGPENRCCESLVPFEEGDKVIVLTEGIVTKNSIETTDVFFVKASAIQDFILRYIQNTQPPKLEETVTEEIVKPQ